MKLSAGSAFIGVDVQSARDCPYAVISDSAELIESGWIPTDKSMSQVAKAICDRHPGALIGIDSPRHPLPSPRQWYWKDGNWKARTTEVGSGRHCEVVIKAHNIANPQWTPIKGCEPEWMAIGYELFALFEQHGAVYEVFPSASYSLLQFAPEVSARLSFDSFRPGPKDMLDAVVGAITILEYALGHGEAVGGGDGLGMIVLPRPIPRPISKVMKWPSDGSA